MYKLNQLKNDLKSFKLKSFAYIVQLSKILNTYMK